jgi:D-sedoheptulose 7-phosphate isomerase
MTDAEIGDTVRQLHGALEASCRLALERVFHMLRVSFRSGGKLLLCGNGGSAADCEHFAAELQKAFLRARPLPVEIKERLERADHVNGHRLAESLQSGLPAISLASQTSILTAVLNDQGGEYVFAQQIAALGKPGDVCLAFSTSGRSRDILAALTTARAFGLSTVGFSGPGGGEMSGLCDVMVEVPGTSTPEIQSGHLACYHALADMLENAFFRSF